MIRAKRNTHRIHERKRVLKKKKGEKENFPKN